jgi:class 3 adenylate cyclase
LVGDRRRLLEAISALRDRDETEPSASRVSEPSSTTTDAERRQITVLFCDIVDSTALSTRLDPEDLRWIITAFQHKVAETAALFSGFVAKYMGDGALLYFGYPRAQETDAEQAVRAGLALAQATGVIEAPGVAIRLRVGIATGLVVVGDLIGSGSAQEQAVVGETPNLAARLQSLADPKTVLICPTTRRLIGELFDCRDSGPMGLRGFGSEVRVTRVIGESAVRGRFEAQLDLLLRRWQRARTVAGQVVLISVSPALENLALPSRYRIGCGATSYPIAIFLLAASCRHGTLSADRPTGARRWNWAR